MEGKISRSQSSNSDSPCKHRIVYRKNSQKKKSSPSFRAAPCEREMTKQAKIGKRSSQLYSSNPDLFNESSPPVEDSKKSTRKPRSVRQMIRNFELVESQNNAKPSTSFRSRSSDATRSTTLRRETSSASRGLNPSLENSSYHQDNPIYGTLPRRNSRETSRCYWSPLKPTANVKRSQSTNSPMMNHNRSSNINERLKHKNDSIDLICGTGNGKDSCESTVDNGGVDRSVDYQCVNSQDLKLEKGRRTSGTFSARCVLVQEP